MTAPRSTSCYQRGQQAFPTGIYLWSADEVQFTAEGQSAKVPIDTCVTRDALPSTRAQIVGIINQCHSRPLLEHVYVQAHS